jgi:hypothetical protein
MQVLRQLHWLVYSKGRFEHHILHNIADKSVLSLVVGEKSREGSGKRFR